MNDLVKFFSMLCDKILFCISYKMLNSKWINLMFYASLIIIIIFITFTNMSLKRIQIIIVIYTYLQVNKCINITYISVGKKRCKKNPEKCSENVK